MCVRHFAQHHLSGRADRERGRDGDRRIREGTPAEPFPWHYGDALFCIFFSAELVLRAIAERTKFLFGKEAAWNAFDTLIVGSPVIETVMAFWEGSMMPGISVLRTLRVLRIIRLLRSAMVLDRARPIVRTLQTIIHSLGGSILPFIASLIMLFIFLYIFGLTFMSGIRTHLMDSTPAQRATEEWEESMQAIEAHYSSVGETLFTLLGAITGGADWFDVALPINGINVWYRLVFLAYILFVLLSVLNILTGIFVNVSFESCATKREIAIEAALANKESMIKEVVNLFAEADEDCSGTISEKEFENYLQDEKIKAFFMSLDLDMSSGHRVFQLIDDSGDGELGIAEFVQGCIDLRGGAKKVDISFLEKGNQKMMARLKKVEELVGGEPAEEIRTPCGSAAREVG